MPTSARGNRRRGFTLIELLVVMAIIAITVGLIAVALPDSTAAQLEREGERLAALLETARAEARASGIPAAWTPLRDASGEHFRFVGMPTTSHLPTRWLDERVAAEVVGAHAVLLGPEPMLPPQRVRLRLAGFVLDIESDGLQPFTPGVPTPAAGT